MAERETIKMNGSFVTRFFYDGEKEKTIDKINLDLTNGPSDSLRRLIKENPEQLQVLIDAEYAPIVVSLVKLHDMGCNKCPDRMAIDAE